MKSLFCEAFCEVLCILANHILMHIIINLQSICNLIGREEHSIARIALLTSILYTLQKNNNIRIQRHIGKTWPHPWEDLGPRTLGGPWTLWGPRALWRPGTRRGPRPYEDTRPYEDPGLKRTQGPYYPSY